MKLVDEFNQCWRWISMWCMTLAGAVQGAWLFIPDDMKASIPHQVVVWATLALLVLGIVGRVVKQDSKGSP